MPFDELTLSTAALLVLGGLIAGFMNVVAGGRSLITMPLLIIAGLPETTANGTTRLAILAQNVFATARYLRAGAVDFGAVRRYVPPVLIGGVAGAIAGAHTPDASFRQMLGWVTLMAATAVVLGPKIFGGKAARKSPHPFWVPISLVAAGFYGGMIQAGVGYLILACLLFLAHMDLVAANVLKVIMVLAYTPIAIAVFAGADRFEIAPAVVLAVGQATGAWIAAGTTLRKGAPFIRAILAFVIAGTALHLLGAFAWITRRLGLT